ncbi:MAG: TlpA disulfide reductase family protein [Candidatus Omnitrophota bacterium]
MVLFIWTTWCPYCLVQLDQLSEQCSYQDVKLVLVNSGEKKQDVRNFIKNRGVPECLQDDIVLDKNSTLARKFSISGYPTFIFLKNGKYLARSYHLNKSLIEKVY